MEGTEAVKSGVSLEEYREELEELKRIKAEREAKSKVETLKKEYVSDEARKAIWEAGLGKKLESNPDIINNENYLNDMVALYMDKAKQQLMKEEKKESKPMHNEKPPIDQTLSSEDSDGDVQLDLKNDSYEDLMKKGVSFTDALLGKAAARYMK